MAILLCFCAAREEKEDGGEGMAVFDDNDSVSKANLSVFSQVFRYMLKFSKLICPYPDVCFASNGCLNKNSAYQKLNKFCLNYEMKIRQPFLINSWLCILINVPSTSSNAYLDTNVDVSIKIIWICVTYITALYAIFHMGIFA